MPTIEFLMTFLLNAFWQAGLITLAAFAAARLLRESGARLKYVIWVSALVLCLCAPLATSFLISLPGLSARSEVVPASFELQEFKATAPQIDPISDVSAATATSLSISISTGLAAVILVGYGIFLICGGMRLARALMRKRAVVNRAVPANTDGHLALVIERCRHTFGSREPEVLISNDIPVPVTVGWLRPVIILPTQLLAETDSDVLLTAIGHEMVHIERRDYALNLLFEFISLPISFHPAVVYVKRRIAQVRELCCDETVATWLLQPQVYARSLLTIAGSAAAANRLSPMITVGITDAENLEVRIMSLLKRSETSFPRKSLVLAAAAIFLAVPIGVAAYLSPNVSVTSSAAEPGAEATPPVRSEDQEREERIVHELIAQVKSIQKVLEDPKLGETQRAELRAEMANVKKELYRRGVEEISLDRDAKIIHKDRADLVELQLAEVTTALQDLNLSEARRSELRAVEEKLRTDINNLSVEKVEIEEIKEMPVDVLVTSRSEVILRPAPPKVRANIEALRQEAQLTSEAAVERALAQYPGRVTEKPDIDRVNGEVVYRVFVRDTPERNARMVIVSGIDGRIVKTMEVPVIVKVVKP